MTQPESKSRRFAETTKVPIGQTQNEIKARLRAAGADQLAVFEGADKSAVAFRLAGRFYRIDVPIAAEAKDAGQEERRAWRLLGLLMKSKLEAVREGATTVEREFLADLVLPDGQTVSQWAAPQLQVAYERGAMPTQLQLEAPR